MLSTAEICGQFTVSPQAIPQHLKVLRETRLVKVEKRAQQRIYQIDPSTVLELEGWARQLRQLWDQRFYSLDQLLESEKRLAKGDE